jgi:hypothetical protein
MSLELDSSLQSCDACGAPLDVADFEPLSTVTCPVCGQAMLVGRYIGQFELLEVMGRGGMGVVYRAQDSQLNRQVALKLLRRDHASNGFLSELESEAAVTASINHPHVVKVFTTGTANGRFYLAMELVDKGTLDHLMELQGRVAEAQALEIAVQIAQGLRAAHQHGLIHRDVKPGNILFSDAHTAKIVDFGLAIMEQAARGSNEVWGTPYYVSPERLDQKAEDFRSDIYSLGATIFHALAGRPPFEAENATLVALKHLKSQAVSLQAFAPWISGSTAFVINRTLLKDPGARYQSYDELIEHLEYARTEVVAHASTPQAKKRVVLETAEDRKREGLLTTVMIAVVALLLIGGGWLFYANTGREKAEAPLSAVAQSVGAPAALAQQYEGARQHLLHRKPALAAEGFHALAAPEAKAPEPFAQWCLAQEGLAWLVAGKLDKARSAFAALGARPYGKSDSNAAGLRSFFSTVARIGADDAPVAPAPLQEVDSRSYAALTLLIAGLKNWELGKFDDGGHLLRQFLSAAPTGGFVWMTEYRELAGDYLADYSDYRGAMAMAKAAQSVPELQAVIATIEKVRGDLKRPEGPLAVELQATAKQATATVEKRLREAAVKLEAEKKALAAVRDKAATQARDWQFEEARATVAAAAVSNPDLQREHRALLRKMDWLAQFRATLLKDLAAGYAGPLKAKGGVTLPGTLTQATPAGVEIGGNAPPVSKKWTELAPDSILAMAASFLPPMPPPVTPPAPPTVQSRDSAVRRWNAGVFAVHTGLKNDAKKLLSEGARGHPELADQLPVLLPPRRTNVAKEKPATSSDSTQDSPAPQGPEKAFDGDVNSCWSLATPGPKWLQVDLGKNMVVARWLARHASSHRDPADGDTADFTIQRSVDNQAWSDVTKVRNNNQGVTDHRVPQFTARYIRMLIERPNRRPNNDPVARIYELEVYGVPGTNEPVGNLFDPPQAAPVPELTSRDLGLAPTEPTGATAVDDRTGLFTIRGAGAGIGNVSDAFRFVHRALNGDGAIVVRFEGVDRSSNEAAKAGIMLRVGTGGDSPMVFLGAGTKPGLLWQVRKTAKLAANTTTEGSLSAPCWLRLEREGNVISALGSNDGLTWKTIGSETLPLPGNLEAGMAVTSSISGTAVNAKMEVVAIGAGR